ncbi:MAG: hypothetical protein H7263_16540 [Candidatus Sericytochromatia bacterium]|nr:hypothetical protein [Candidatus Sericytochromatia bacterium]
MIDKMDIYFCKEPFKHKNSYLLSKQFILLLEEIANFKVIRKISEGGSNLVLLALSKPNRKNYVLLVNKNINYDIDTSKEKLLGYKIIIKMQKKDC